MRFALFGKAPIALSVARAVAAHPAHELTRVVVPPSSPAALPQPGRSVRTCESWEELLADSELDAVIISDESEDGRQAVRQLLQAGKAALVTSSLVQTAEFFYEMSLVEAERPGRLFPLLGLRGHPLVGKLREVISQNGLGRLRHARIERTIAVQTAGDSAPIFSEPELERAFLPDADLLEDLCGGYNQVAASRSGTSDDGFSLATVTLSGGGGAPQAVWTAAAAVGDHWRFSLSGESGTAILEGNPELGKLKLTLQLSGQAAVAQEADFDAAPWLLETFIRTVESGRRAEAGLAIELTAPEEYLWGELARVVEIVEAVERSIRRRRTIDVYFDTPSERGIFKTQMTAAGCSLLVLTLAAVVVYAVLEAAVNLAPPLRHALVTLIFLPLGVFLAMQLFVFVARPGR